MPIKTYHRCTTPGTQPEVKQAAPVAATKPKPAVNRTTTVTPREQAPRSNILQRSAHQYFEDDKVVSIDPPPVPVLHNKSQHAYNGAWYLPTTPYRPEINASTIITDEKGNVLYL